MRILSLAAAALVAAAMPTEALECRQFGGTCKSKSAGCENGSFRRGFCSGSSVCCVGHEGTRSNFNIKTVGKVNDGHGHTVTIKKFASGNSNRIEPTIFFKAKMAVDADGANSAYNPNDSGIDYLANAGCKNNRGSCYGIGKVNGRLAKQDSNSEYPGFYTSSTSLAWSHSSSAMTKSDNFIDSLKVPYVVVPGGKTFRSRYGARVGDLGVIYDPKTNYVVPVYAADSGPATKIGEASIRLMEVIGHKVYDRNNRCNLGISPSRGIVYVLFSGSGSGRPYTLTDLWKNVEEQIKHFGGMAAIAKAVDAPSPVLMSLEQFCAAPTFHPKFNTGRNPNYKVPEGRYCSPTYPSPAEGTMNGGTPVTPAEGSAPTADEAPADSPGSEIIDAAEDALETCDNHGDLFCRPGKSSCAHGYHSGECRGDTWCCKPEPQLAACDNHPDLVCRPGKSSCSNGIHFGECRGDTWCCK